MKKITAVLLTLVMAVLLMACSGNTQTSDRNGCTSLGLDSSGCEAR